MIFTRLQLCLNKGDKEILIFIFLLVPVQKKKNRSLDGRDKSSSIVYFDQFNLMNSLVDQTSSNNRLLELCKSKIVWEDEGPVFYSELQKKMTLGHFF